MAKLFLFVTLLYFINGVTSEFLCLENRYGPACQYECHCRSGGICDIDRGCGGFCDTDNGWDGPTCQRKNVVLKRPDVHQGPGVWRSPNTNITYPADLVVDGRIGHHFYDTPCALTVDSTTVKAWWNVTLDEEYYIYRFDLYNRNDEGRRRNNGFILSVGRSSAPGFDYKDCYRDTETGDPPLILKGTCINDTPLKGDVIQIRQTTFKPLQICELIVQVCATGWYGEECNRMCTTKNNCTRCDEGQISCEECVRGRWGEHCTDTCNSNCLGGVNCNKTTGRCPEDKCAAGFKGYTCNQHCPDGKYGPDCSTSCGKCIDGGICNKTTGHCPDQCSAGYEGTRCETVCPDGKYGVDCGRICSQCLQGTVCFKDDGRCPNGCEAGYYTAFCSVVCMDGLYGSGCNTPCGHCRDDQFCDKITGYCPAGCSDGFTGELCQEECVDGYYGPDCSTPCENCFDGSPCNKTDGSCPNRCYHQNSPISDGNKSSECPSVLTLYIAVAVLAVLCMLVSAIAVMFYVKLRKVTRLHEEDVRARYTNMQMKPGGEETQAPDPVYEEMKN